MIKETPVEGTLPVIGAGMPLGRRLRVTLGQDWAVAWLFVLPTVF